MSHNQRCFREGEEIAEWMSEKGWKKTSDVFLNFTNSERVNEIRLRDKSVRIFKNKDQAV